MLLLPLLALLLSTLEDDLRDPRRHRLQAWLKPAETHQPPETVHLVIAHCNESTWRLSGSWNLYSEVCS